MECLANSSDIPDIDKTSGSCNCLGLGHSRFAKAKQSVLRTSKVNKFSRSSETLVCDNRCVRVFTTKLSPGPERQP